MLAVATVFLFVCPSVCLSVGLSCLLITNVYFGKTAEAIENLLQINYYEMSQWQRMMQRDRHRRQSTAGRE